MFLSVGPIGANGFVEKILYQAFCSIGAAHFAMYNVKRQWKVAQKIIPPPPSGSKFH